MELIQSLIPIIAPVLICALIGYTWAKSNLPFHSETIGELVMKVGAPCLVISTLSKVQLSMSDFLAVAQYALIIALTMTALGLICIKIWKLNVRTYLGSILFANVGNMGLPICYFAYGDTGLAYGLAYFMLISIAHFSIGVGWMSGDKFLKSLLTNPIVHSIWIALILLYTETTLPKWLSNTTDLLAGFTIPLMLIALGVSLSQLKVEHMSTALKVALLRILGGFLVAFLLTELLNIEGLIRGILIIQSSMPVAVFNYLLAQRFNRQPAEIAGMVMASTLLSFATMPLLLWVVLL